VTSPENICAGRGVGVGAMRRGEEAQQPNASYFKLNNIFSN
jgi:hypothetical protein